MMNIRTVKTLAAAALLAGMAAGVPAQELKIGYVNSDRVLRDALPAKAAQAKLEAEFSKREKDLNELATRLKAASDRLDKESPTLAETERVRRQRRERRRLRFGAGHFEFLCLIRRGLRPACGFLDHVAVAFALVP